VVISYIWSTWGKFLSLLSLLSFFLSTFHFIKFQKASLQFLSDTRLENRKVLAVYPILLFYFVLSWIILISATKE